MNSKLLAANTKLILSGMLAGALSSGALIMGGSLESLLMFLPGAALGGCLSLGVALTNYRHREELNNKTPPGWQQVNNYVILTGILATAIIATIYLSRPPVKGDFDIFPWYGALAAFSYAATLLPAYHARWYQFYDTWFRFVLLGGIASGFFWGMLYFIIPTFFFGGLHTEMLGLSLFIALCKGLPFAFLWGLSVWLFNPAHTLERWQKINGKVDEVDKKEVD